MKTQLTNRRFARVLSIVAVLAMPLAPVIQAITPLPRVVVGVAALVSASLLYEAVYAKSKTKKSKDKGNSANQSASKGNRKAIAYTSGKIDICHKAGQSGKFVDINVDTSASCAHLGEKLNEDGTTAAGSCGVVTGHDGDYYGRCSTLDEAVDLQVIGCTGEYLTSLITAIKNKDEADKAVEESADVGLFGGHIDVATSTTVYGNGLGAFGKYVDAWDDTYDLTTIDFFDINGTLDDIDGIINTSQLFYVTVSNAALSTGGVLEINGVRYTVEEYEGLVANHQAGGDPLQTFMLGDPNEAQITAGVRKLSSLSLTFDVSAILAGGVMPTNDTCVENNNYGPADEYRNGALLVQAINASTGTLHASKYYALTNLLWEATVFWHWEPTECYHNTPDWQTQYDDCVTDGSCLSDSQHKKDFTTSEYKIYMCHKAGNSGNYNLLNISKNAYCAHRGSGDVGQQLDADGVATGVACVPSGHTGDSYMGTVASYAGSGKGKDTVPDCSGDVVDKDTTYSITTTELKDKLEDCIDDEKGGGFMGYAETGRISWKQIISE